MATALWIGYDTFVFAVGYWLLERKLTQREKYVLVVVVLAGLSVAVYGFYADRSDAIKNATLRQTVADTQTECESTRRDEMNLRATVVAVAAKLNANPSPDEIKAAAAQLFSVSRSITIKSPGSFAVQAVIRDRTGKVVQRSTSK